MDRLTDLCLRHRRIVALLWLVVTLVGLGTAGGLQKRLDATFSLPGQKAYEVNQAIQQAYGNGGNASPIVIAVTDRSTRLDTPAARAALTTAFTKAAEVGRPMPFRALYPGTPGAAGSVDDAALLSHDGHTAFGLVLQPQQGGFDATDPATAMRPLVASSLATTLPGATVGVTGFDQLASSGGGGGGSGVLVETLLGALGALVILAFVFGSFLAVLPMLMAASAIGTTYLLVTGLTEVTSVSFIVQFLVALIGLGVAIDYALLVVTRWREERGKGLENEAAVRQAMRTAGHSVVFSGVTVAVGLFSLIFLPVPFLRSVAYGGVLIPLVSVLVATTLLPVLLLWWGPALDRVGVRKHGGDVSRPWAGWARLVVRFRWVAAAVALAILGSLVFAASHIAVGEPRASTLAKSGPAYDALQQLEAAGIPVGTLTPVEVLVPHGDGSAVVAATRDLPGVLTSFVSGSKPGATTVEVLPVADTNQPPGSGITHVIAKAVAPLGGEVGGTGAGQQAFEHAVYGTFPLMLAVIVVLTFLLLARAFRSILLPIKAVILNLISVGATYGVLVLVWQEGHGSRQIWDIGATGAITSFVPLMVFAFLFGLSMDYEVFILARMREEYDAGRDTNAAVVEGVGRTGRLVTSAALILFAAFLSLSQAPNTDIKIFATGLGAGILLDATVVRALLVPALVSLFGRWNWAMPAPFAKALWVRPSPLEPPGREPEREP
ncbi:MAG TPA: MMPL family transporter, partial [Mycobacteriales bacterium]